jgi:hypothetical protein
VINLRFVRLSDNPLEASRKHFERWAVSSKWQANAVAGRWSIYPSQSASFVECCLWTINACDLRLCLFQQVQSVDRWCRRFLIFDAEFGPALPARAADSPPGHQQQANQRRE